MAHWHEQHKASKYARSEASRVSLSTAILALNKKQRCCGCLAAAVLTMQRPGDSPHQRDSLITTDHFCGYSGVHADQCVHLRVHIFQYFNKLASWPKSYNQWQRHFRNRRSGVSKHHKLCAGRVHSLLSSREWHRLMQHSMYCDVSVALTRLPLLLPLSSCMQRQHSTAVNASLAAAAAVIAQWVNFSIFSRVVSRRMPSGTACWIVKLLFSRRSPLHPALLMARCCVTAPPLPVLVCRCLVQAGRR